MRSAIVIIILALLMGGCIDILGEKVPVLYAKVTMGEEVNGTPVIQKVEAYAGEMPKSSAPRDQYPENFPAVYVDAVQKANKLNYQTGKDYKGPGVYELVIGIDREINMSEPVAVMVEMVTKDKNSFVEGMRFNWSTEVQSKTFK